MFQDKIINTHKGEVLKEKESTDDNHDIDSFFILAHLFYWKMKGMVQKLSLNLPKSLMTGS